VLIAGGLVVGADGDAARVDLRERDGTIVELGPGLRPGPGEEVIAADRRLVVPGLVNAHIHSNEGYLKGRFDRLTLEAWLQYAYPPTGVGESSVRDVYVRTLVGALEHLRRGTTTVVDFLYDLPRPTMDSLGAVCAGYRDAGLRAVLAIAIWDEPFFASIGVPADRLPGDVDALDPRGPDVAEWREILDEAIVRWHRPEERLTIAVAPDQVQRCSDPLLALAAELAERHDLPMHVHVLESRLCRAAGRRRYGESQIAHLARFGALTERTSIVHGVWADASDIDLLADHHATLVHNPVSNLKLGSGVAPIPDCLSRGVAVALGTDGDSTNDGRDLYETMKLAALIHRVGRPDPERWIGAEEAWSMATDGSARAAGMDGRIGRLEPGLAADIVLLDLDDLALLPPARPLIQLVYAGASHAVREVVVGGRLVVREGRSTLVGEADLIREVRERGRRHAAALDAGRSAADALVPLILEVHAEAWGSMALDDPRAQRR
jgi:cytosine/adenosine deaminase-related metal-dependent hydrolase